jgi:hypothetical protein
VKDQASSQAAQHEAQDGRRRAQGLAAAGAQQLQLPRRQRRAGLLRLGPRCIAQSEQTHGYRQE